MRKNRANQTEGKSEIDRLQSFRNAARYGPIFTCCSCEQNMYEKGVIEIDKKLKIKIKTACDEKDKDRFQEIFEDKLKSTEYLVQIYFEDRKTEANHFICHTCKNHLTKGNIPPMSAANGLRTVHISDNLDLKLGELENNLIAKRFCF